MDRKTKLLSGIDISRSVGVEIGALCRPFVTRRDGRVYYVDHVDTNALRERFSDDPNVDVNELVNVDVVWGERPLDEAIPERVDYVVASHVIEHVPDLISWVHELAAILKPSGEIRLIVPDRRFTFDYLRRETRLADLVYANMVQARVPLPHIVLDYVMNAVKLDGIEAWRGGVQPDALLRHHTLAHAINCAKQATQGAYHDVHCWVFTPRSFSGLMIELANNQLAVFECTSFYDTAPLTIEFFVGMRPTTDVKTAVESWERAARHCAE